MIFGSESFEGYPVTEDGVSFGTISVNNVTPLLEIDRKLISGSLNYETVTITLKGIPQPPPFAKRTLTNVADFVTFNFRDKTWHLLNTEEGPKFRIASEQRYFSWSCTGVNLDEPLFNA